MALLLREPCGASSSGVDVRVTCEGEPMNTPWSTVAERSEDPMWRRLAEMCLDELEDLVRAAVSEAMIVLEKHRKVFEP